MNRLRNVFGTGGRAAFIGYLVAGDPTPAVSVAVAREMIAGGVDILEIGIPFSDPVADGPVLQNAHERALSAGATPDTAFALARELRDCTDTPLVLMTYANIVYRRGIPRFYADARAAGADGVLIVDVPVEEADPFLDAARQAGIDPIFLIAPTTSETRIARIVAAGKGYIYIISSAGVTGARTHLSGGIADTLHTVRRHTDLPLAVGFGISTPAQVRSLCDAGADGVIVGSAFADIIGRNKQEPAVMLHRIGRFIRSLRDAIPLTEKI